MQNSSIHRNTHQMIQQHTGAIGTTVTASTGVLGLLTNNVPTLQAISLVVSIIVGLLTIAWYIRRFYKE
jgi:hypothetical protein